MFNAIAHKYDFLNHLLSMGIDRVWRNKAIKMLTPYKPAQILDIATGTGDFAIAALKLNPQKVVGIDISEGMLEKGKAKIIKKGYASVINLQLGDSENMTFPSNSFDAITIGFGVRNFENVNKGLAEMCRVLKQGGVVAVLEFTKPASFPFKQIYKFYFFYILPIIGKLFSKNSEAYSYLPESVMAFPERADFIDLMHQAGFVNGRFKVLTMGIASIYFAEKP